MLAIGRRTYRVQSASLTTLSCALFFGSLTAAIFTPLEHVDVLLRLAVFPGGLIAGVLAFLVNGCLEYYADCLPARYRARPNARSSWQAIYGDERLFAVESVLKQFVRAHGFRETDAFQFEPEDRLDELMHDFYGRRANAERYWRRADLTCRAADVPLPPDLRSYVEARIAAAFERPLDAVPADATPEVATLDAARRANSPSGVDRMARDRLAGAIRRFMDASLTAFAFDEEIHAIGCATADKTVETVVCDLWYHYDDCKDHLVRLSKLEWDYFQRLLLLLDSDAQIEQVRQRHWSVRQVFAALGLCGFGYCMYRFGFGWHLSGFALLFGPLSMLLAYWRSRSEMRAGPKQQIVVPFSSFAELRAVRRAVPSFAKKKFPADTKQPRVHSRLFIAVLWLKTAVLWSFISPLVLFFQMLPARESYTRVRLAGASSARP